MTSTRDRKERPGLFGVGAITVLLTAFSALMALVSLALYRAERDEIEGDSNAEFSPDWYR